MAEHIITVTDDEQFERAVRIVGNRMRKERYRTVFYESQIIIANEHKRHVDLRKQAFFRGCKVDDLQATLDMVAADWRATEQRLTELDDEMVAAMQAAMREPLPRFIKRMRTCSTAFTRHSEFPVIEQLQLPGETQPPGVTSYVSDKYLVKVGTQQVGGSLLVARLYNRDTGECKSTQRSIRMEEIFVLTGDRLEVQTRDNQIARIYCSQETGVALPFLNFHTTTTETRIYNPSTDKYVRLPIESSGSLNEDYMLLFATPHKGRHYLRFEPGNGHPVVVVSISTGQLF